MKFTNNGKGLLLQPTNVSNKNNNDVKTRFAIRKFKRKRDDRHTQFRNRIMRKRVIKRAKQMAREASIIGNGQRGVQEINIPPSENISNYTRLIDSIDTIGRNEQYLLQRLRNLQRTGSTNLEEINEIKQQLRELQDSRITQYQTLRQMYYQHAEELDQSSVVSNKTAMLKLLEGEIEQMRHNLDSMNVSKMNKRRLVQVYTYEKEKYYAKIELLQLIGYTLVALLLLFILRRLFLPKTLTMILASVIIAIGTIMVIYKMHDISIRDPMYFEKYKQPIDEKILLEERNADYSDTNNGATEEEQQNYIANSRCSKSN